MSVYWTKIETEILKLNYDKSINELVILIPNRTNRSIFNKLKSLGIYDDFKKIDNNRNELNRKDRLQNKLLKSIKNKKKWGGLRIGSGRGKKGTYRGYFCDSSYELVWIIYQLEHNITFIRNTEKFKYRLNGEEKNFIPDFIVNNVYYEIKGYDNGSVSSKIDSFPHKIVLLYKKDIEYMFEYVISKYGKNYLSLYEDRKYKSCSICNGYICRANKSGRCRKCYCNSFEYKEKVKSIKTSVYVKNRLYKNCLCGNKILKESNLCKICFLNKLNVKQSLDSKIPDVKILLIDINELGYTGAGRKYSVSDTTVRKWCKKYNISKIKKKVEKKDKRIINKPTKKELILEVDKHGVTKTGRKYGVHHSTITYWLRTMK